MKFLASYQVVSITQASIGGFKEDTYSCDDGTHTKEDEGPEDKRLATKDMAEIANNWLEDSASEQEACAAPKCFYGTAAEGLCHDRESH